MVKTPATRHAQRSAANLLTKLRELVPSAWIDSIPQLQAENITKIADSNWYSFGRLSLGVSAMRRLSKIHTIDMDSMREIARLHYRGETLLETPPPTPANFPVVEYAGIKMNSNWLSVTSCWRDWFFTVVAALPMDRQLLLLNNKDIADQHWTIEAREGPKLFNLVKASARSSLDVTMVDFLMNLLFWELRWDTIIQDESLPRWSALLTICRTQGPTLIQNKNIPLVISYAMRRTEKNKTGSVSNKVKEMKVLIEEALFGQNAKKHPDNAQIKKDRDTYFEKHAKRIYFCDFFRHNGFFALANRTSPKDYWVRLEREHVWADEV